MTALRPDVSGIAVDARLFHEARCRLVHKYRVYKDPFPHPVVRGGGGGASSADIVCGPGYGHHTAHASAHFIPASRAPPGQVPEECFRAARFHVD